MKALILAGGSGKRLSENSNNHNKCMLQLFGKPLVQYSLENAVRVGVSAIVMVVGYRAEEIINGFGNRFQNVRIKYVIQHDAKGLVHAIECARDAIGDSDFMLFLADEILRSPRHQEMIDQFYSEDLFFCTSASFSYVLRAFRTQLKAIKRWGRSTPADLSLITQPTLIANGDNDRMVPTALSEDMHQRITGSQLTIYPNSGHGAIFQYHREFAPAGIQFLDAD